MLQSSPSDRTTMLSPKRINAQGALFDLEGENETEEGQGPPELPDNVAATSNEEMNVCLESPVQPISNGADQSDTSSPPISLPAPIKEEEEESPLPPQKNLAKLVLTTIAPTSNSTLLQKVSTSSVITVVSATGPLTILKTICSNPVGTSAPQFTLVNSTPLAAGNPIVKPITVVTAPPVTLLKTITNVHPAVTTQLVEEGSVTTQEVEANSTTDRPPIHNVYVKNTSVLPELVVPSDEEVEKIGLTPTNTPHIIKAVPVASVPKPTNCQNADPSEPSNKIKFIGNVLVSSPASVITSTNPSNIILNKALTPKPILQQKPINNSSLNGTQKFVNKNLPIPPNVIKSGPLAKHNKPPEKLTFPTHKTQIRMMAQVNNVAKPGIKTLSPQTKGIPPSQQVQRIGMGLRTIPPQRPKVPNKPNYIGKHAIQAQKFRSPHNIGKLKNIKPPVPSNNLFPHRTPQNTGVTYHQALTANIIQSLTENTSSRPYDFNARYDNFNDVRPQNTFSDSFNIPSANKPQSNLEALSFVCQAVLLDHNYNAMPPSEPITRPVPSNTATVQHNGGNPAVTYYSPPNGTRNRSSSLGGSTNTLSTLSSTSIASIPTSVNNCNIFPDDDAASDISCGSERKIETEGEETDTAPEAEAVGNEDHYGDYVTRCICGFLHDDGYMIECDKCKVWQHVRCVIKSNKKVPEDYFCEMCDSTKPVDKAKARSVQQQWMRENQDVKFRKESHIRDLKMKEMSDTDSSDGEQIDDLSKNRIGIITRRKSENSPRPLPRQRRDSLKSESVRRKRKERKLPKKKVKTSAKSQSEDESMDTWQNQTILQMPQLRQWIEHYEEAVTNHYSPELRARISNIRVNGTYSDLSTQFDANLNKCRVYTQPLTSLKYLVTSMHLLPNTPIIELRGKYMLSTQHRGSLTGHTGALTTRQHAQRPGPFLFFYRLPKDNTEVCVDTRTYGNDARFIRRSCKPNSELRHCIEKGVLHLYIVSLATIESNIELTIKHESHDLAAVGTTHISCVCGTPSECTINNPVKKNGETTETSNARKRRGRRSSIASEIPKDTTQPLTPKESLSESATTPEPPLDVKPELEDIKPEPPVEDVKEIKPEINIKKCESPIPLDDIKMEDEISSPSPPLTRRLSQFPKNEEISDEKKESICDSKKKSREERKIEAYMKAFERMERLEQRKQEHQAKQAHRRESDPSPQSRDDEKSEKMKRRRRKGRSRTISTTSQTRNNRLNSADSYCGTSGDECLLSPTDSIGNSKDASCDSSPTKEKDSAMPNCNNRIDLKSPIRDVDCNSNCANLPETPLSSACLLVAAAVEPLERGFKFPKTKKGLMNEWLNKSPDGIQQSSLMSSQNVPENLFETPVNGFFNNAAKSLSAPNSICDVAQLHCNAKKRWLRQAISEDHGDSQSGRPDSPPISEMVAPPKKRRLPRESISNDITPPSTPINSNGTANLTGSEDTKEREDRVEIVTAEGDGDSPSQEVIDDATLKDRVAEMQQEIGSCFRLPPDSLEAYQKDPRLAKAMLNNSEQLVATVEKNLTILGFEEQKIEVPAPTKRKLSINEYRQRKQLSVSEKTSDDPLGDDYSNTQPSSPLQKARPRTDSSSSSSTSCLSSDDENHASELTKKTFSAFNSEPTELEKQREGVSLRLKKAFGLTIKEGATRKPALNMEAILNCDLGISTPKRLYSPTFPVPGSSTELPLVLFSVSEDAEPKPKVVEPEKVADMEQDVVEAPLQAEPSKLEMFYTPDDEEKESKIEKSEVHMEENKEKCCDFNEDSANYVPPFNNPVYPNSSFASFGSVIDDAPYEGRNPSPPPDLSKNVPVSYSSS